MILRQYLHTDPTVAISYLFGCGGRATGAVVDAVAEPAFYMREARARTSPGWFSPGTRS